MRTGGYFNVACPHLRIQIIQDFALLLFQGVVRYGELADTPALLGDARRSPGNLNMIQIIEIKHGIP